MAPSRPRLLGMAVPKETIAVAYVAPEHAAAGTVLGPSGPRPGALAALLRTMPSQATPLLCVSAAGPWGSWLSRDRTQQDDACGVVAPSWSPTTPGDRGTTARRDARPGARVARADALPVVDGPQVDEEARRARARARADTLRALQAATCRLTACWLRQESRSPGRAPWGPAPRHWLAAGVCPPPAPHSVLHADVRAVTAPPARRPRLAPALHDPVPAWRLPPVGAALQARRGVPCTAAVPMGAAMGALPRCESPRARLQGWGLRPSAYPSAARRRHGALTTAGHTQARRARGAGAWASRAPAKGRRHLPRRLEQHPHILQAIRGTAPGRLWPHSRQRRARGNPAPGVTGARARALAGCMGAMAQQVPGPLSAQDSVRRHDARRRRADGHRTRRSPGGVSPTAA